MSYRAIGLIGREPMGNPPIPICSTDGGLFFWAGLSAARVFCYFRHWPITSPRALAIRVVYGAGVGWAARGRAGIGHRRGMGGPNHSNYIFFMYCININYIQKNVSSSI